MRSIHRFPLITVHVLLAAVLAVWAHADGIDTSRGNARPLKLPDDQDAFGFVIFGDRTGGPAEGIQVLAQAVHDANLLDPDLVMTVGDLVQGYNTTRDWLPQMREFHGVMDRLEMPWFPVAGNHDIYWRGEGKPRIEHEGNFETHFGPLWYSFQHRDSRFIVLYSDEPNPETGERNFNKPDCQRMSPEQFEWLRTTLEQSRQAKHVFLFLHHPRWLDWKYGNDWEKVHRLLVDAGNVSAVFAGHIHHMRYEGRRDGIEYFALATTGGVLNSDLPEAGFLHEYHVVTVRDRRVSVATLPVGAALDPRQITGALSEDVGRLNRNLRARMDGCLAFTAQGAVEERITFTVENPGSRPIEVTLTPYATDRRWFFFPDHDHRRIAPGQVYQRSFQVFRSAGPFDENFDLPELVLDCDYLGESLRVPLEQRRETMDCRPPSLDVEGQRPDLTLRLDGKSRCLALESSLLDLPDGPFTVEGWVNGDDFAGRRGFVNKTENSGFGLFVGDGKPGFLLHIGGRYRKAEAARPLLEPGRWHHVAGVFDGRQVLLYVDGRLQARSPARGARTRNEWPLYIGADPDRSGSPTSHFAGQIDEIRISTVARYLGDSFEPIRRFQPDEQTLLLLHMDEVIGPWSRDSSGNDRHPMVLGSRSRG